MFRNLLSLKHHNYIILFKINGMKHVRYWPCSPSVDSQTHENGHTKLEEKDEEKHKEVEWAITPTRNKTTINILVKTTVQKLIHSIHWILLNSMFLSNYYRFKYCHLLDSYVAVITILKKIFNRKITKWLNLPHSLIFKCENLVQ